MTVAEPAVVASASTGGRELQPLLTMLEPMIGRARARGRHTLVSATVRIGRRDPVALFAAAEVIGAEPSLWHRPDDGFSLLALDAAWTANTTGPDRFEAVAKAWADLNDDAVVSAPEGARGTGPLLVGGFGFSPEAATTATWRGFEGASLVLPRLLLTSTSAGCWLTANLLVSDESMNGAIDGVATRWQRLAGATAEVLAPQSPEGLLRVVSSRPEASDWRASVVRMAGAVGRGRIDKVVLARQIELEAPAPIDVPGVLRRLSASAPTSTLFAIRRGPRTFVGATPERLIFLEGREFRTVAMAGSTRRAPDRSGDELLAAELLQSDKEREEHQVVVDMLQRTLAPLSERLDIPATPAVVALRHVQHLATPVSGRLRESRGIISLVEQLHPTPAVGGAPRDLALELIEDEEEQERGWYAAPLGWVDRHGDGEFVVALRCGIVAGDGATLFAGCGIVADSDPEREWEESQVKLRALGSALGRIEP